MAHGHRARSITLEPGGQFELSGAPLETLHEAAAENAEHIDEVKQVAGEIGASFIGLGFAPEMDARGHALDAQGPLQDHARVHAQGAASSAST
jgi:gamma-glutamylcysteine synthetase